MILNQEELRGALEKVKHLQNAVQDLDSQRTLMQTNLQDSENTSQQQELQVDHHHITDSHGLMMNQHHSVNS